MIKFGQVAQNSMHICFDVPKSSTAQFTAPPAEENLSREPSHSESGILDFGKKLENAATSLENTIKHGVPTTGKLSFSAPGLEGFESKIQSIKFPTTICVSVGGVNNSLQDVLTQLNNAIDSVPTPNFTIPIPNLAKLPFLPLTGLLGIGQIIPVTETLPQILNQIELQCANLILDNLDNIDPLLRLEQLIRDAQELCGLLQFSQLQAVISKIEQAKGDLIAKLINEIAAPAEKMAKLVQLYIDAVNAGAMDIVRIIANAISRLQFESILDAIKGLNPEDAIAALSNELKNQAQLGNFGVVKQLLNAINIVQSQFNQITGIGDAILQEPANIIGSIQNKINELVDLQDYTGIQQLLTAYDSAEYAVLQQLQQLDPNNLLIEGEGLLNQALQSLDISKYDAILNTMASKICTSGKNLLPSLPNVPEINPADVPSFLR